VANAVAVASKEEASQILISHGLKVTKYAQL